ncbi:MAG: hypothetical protein FIA99_01560 [Ruminiclostridium sp.]|nr:hypothetical protein [Ruminiclostridium sp.]
MDGVVKVGRGMPLYKKRFDWKLAKKMKVLYLMLLLPVAWVLIFHYEPMYGVIMAFVDYKMAKGICGSECYNFEYFR